MKKLTIILTGLLIIISAACSKKYSYNCHCKQPGSTSFGEPIGETYPKAKQKEAEETCAAFSTSERTCSPVFNK